MAVIAMLLGVLCVVCMNIEHSIVYEALQLTPIRFVQLFQMGSRSMLFGGT